MPFNTPTLEDWRKRGRDYVLANMPVRSPLLPNSPLRVMSDNSAGMSYMVMLYLAELAEQLLPDTAQGQWLQRHAQIWLQGGPKPAAMAIGTILLTGTFGIFVPTGTIFTVTAADGTLVQLETTADTTLGPSTTSAPARALTGGAAGNLDPGTILTPISAIQGLNGQVTVSTMTGGADAETDDELRVRVLDRIRQPPMGGDADDYVAWAMAVPGVTRAWASPLEMGMGTVTVRFMMDDLRATDSSTTNGFPLSSDITAVQEYLDSKRPVAVKDIFVVAPIPEPISFGITGLSPSTGSDFYAILDSVSAMLRAQAAPAYGLNGERQDAQTIYAAWVSDAIYQTPGVDYFDLTMTDHVMPSNGSLAVLGNVTNA